MITAQPKQDARGRKLAAILAAMLVASVLAVVAGSSAQAANTASEHMVDTNDDGKVDSREFGGADRYETALMLAKRYAQERGGLGSIDAVIVASGVTLIDAVTSSGLSQYKQAPVLLTRPEALDARVARFIEDHGVSEVIVTGGEAALPASIVAELEALESEPKVMRLAGADRAGTAVAIAEAVGAHGSWCGTDDKSALLVRGATDAAYDAISAGPVAYALELPLLLSGVDELSEASSAFISGEKVERVVILGGAGSVSDGVADAVKALGASVTRVGGGSAAETSAMLAELMAGDCRDDLQTDLSRVALVNSVATADGVSAGPVLGAGFGGGPVPVLLVTDELPAAVRDYLAGTPEVDASGAKTHLSVVAVGGTAVVSEAVMEAAVEAAMSADALSAEIKASPTAAGATDDAGTAKIDESKGTFTLTFSDSVDPASYPKLKDALYVNGSPASVMVDSGGGLFIDGTGDASCSAKASVTVSLTHPLKQGDRIEVRPSASTTVGAEGDQRVLAASSFTVPAAAAASSARPSTEIVAVVGQTNVFVVSDLAGTGDAMKVKVRRGSTTVTSTSGSSVASVAQAPFGHRYTFAIPDVDSATAELKAGDVVILEAGAVTATASDTQAATKSRATSRTVTAAKRLKVNSIHVSQVDPGVDDDPATATAPDMRSAGDNPVSMLASATVPGTGDASVDPSASNNPVTVKAKWSGDAAGAAGNAWSVSVDEVTGIDKTAKTPEIDVSVNDRNKVIRVRYMAGTPTVADLVAALNGNDDFAGRFSASAKSCVADNLKAPVTTATVGEANLGGGRSSVGVTVTFNDWVQALAGSPAGGALKRDVFGALIAGYTADVAEGSTVAETAGLAADASTAYAVSAARFTVPYNRVHFLVTTKNPAKLPSTRSGSNVVAISTGDQAAGTAAVAAGYVATGYLADNADPATNHVDENRNAGGRVSARRSNSVPVS